MKKTDIRTRMNQTVPAMPAGFHSAITQTLAGLAQEAPEAAPGIAEKPAVTNAAMHIIKPAAKPAVNCRRVLVIALAATLLLAAVAAAATILRGVFEVTLGDAPANAPALTQTDLVRETVGNAEITVKQAAYDGMTLSILYGIRDTAANEPLGTPNTRSGERALTESDEARIVALGVGAWLDNLWIDGQIVHMPNMSATYSLPGTENGEILYYNLYRLDQENLVLDGKNVEIALPIGKRQKAESLARDPQTGELLKPQQGMVTFHMDCSARNGIVTETPNMLMQGTNWSAKVSKAVYSPIQLYITVDWTIKPDVLAAYIAENGDGYYENGIKLWDYDALEVCGSEIMNLQLVDQAGKPVFENMQGYYGCGGASATEAWYTFPYAESYPSPMYLAPELDGEPDMSQAIRVR